MSSSFEPIDGENGRRSAVRRQVQLLGSVGNIHGSSSVLIEDLCSDGARLLGRHLPSTGEEILLRTYDMVVLGRIAWASKDSRGVQFEEGDTIDPSIIEQQLAAGSMA